MNKITFPLRQDTLRLCLDRDAILANDEAARRELAEALKREHIEQIYGDATGKLVSIFQRERNLKPSGEVDEPTANALNALLKEWGVLDQPTEPLTPRSFVVTILNQQILQAEEHGNQAVLDPLLVSDFT